MWFAILGLDLAALAYLGICLTLDDGWPQPWSPLYWLGDSAIIACGLFLVVVAFFSEHALGI